MAVISLLVGALLVPHVVALSAQQRVSMGRLWQPSHGEITEVPGFDGPLPSK